MGYLAATGGVGFVGLQIRSEHCLGCDTPALRMHFTRQVDAIDNMLPEAVEIVCSGK